MSNNNSLEPMVDIYIFETTQLIEQLEQVIINSEKLGSFSEEAVNEIFRIMHTIKGSSSMMMFNHIARLAHSIEDLFYFLRGNPTGNFDYSKLADIVLGAIDFIKMEVDKIMNGQNMDGDVSGLISDINRNLDELKQNGFITELNKQDHHLNQIIDQQKICTSPTIFLNAIKINTYKVILFFEDGCEMEDIRAFSIVQNLSDVSEEIHHIPKDIFENNDAVDTIRKEGFKIILKTSRSYDEIYQFLMLTPYVKECKFEELSNNNDKTESHSNEQNVLEATAEKIPSIHLNNTIHHDKKETPFQTSQQSIISVNVAKLDHLMDIVGELVISEAMVTQNPDLNGLNLENFQKSSRQLKKITGELQDIVMSIRMVPLKATFQKLNRIVRDMSKKLGKEVRLEIIGEETEVDKNIIEHISDPLMHIIRNSIDHGLEPPEERVAKGKPETGTVTLEAKNAGGDVLIMIKDDGRGLSREKIITKAKENGLVNRPENELSDKEIFSYIFSPGFSTKERVTEFSGRGVGMDVVVKNIGAVGGTVSVDSMPNISTTMTLKIPLTLAIMDGMIIRVGKSTYIVPIMNIRESFRAKGEDVITDPDGNEMMMIRGGCYPILRLHKRYHVKTDITSITAGIILLVENDGKGFCILADELLGKEQVVVKALPDYIKNFKNVSGLAGCTLLGDGSISLILDISTLMF